MKEQPLDKFGENVLQQREQRRRRPYFTIPGEILLSDALKAVACTTAPMVFLQIVVRQPYPPNAKEIARLKKARLWPQKSVVFSFPQREAVYHGLGVKAWRKGIRELHRVGIINIVDHGSAKRGDFTTYVLSERWRLWGKAGFDARPWPKAKFVPKRDEGGTEQFVKNSRKEGMRKLLEANATSIDPRIEAERASIPPLIEAQRAVNNPLASALIEAQKTLIIDYYQGSEAGPKVQDSEGRSKKKVRTPDPGSKSIATPFRRDDATTKQWRPPLSEIRENVAEILKQRPDPRADDPQFIRRISDQLKETLAGRLDPRRVHNDFMGKHGLDDWTTDLLFTIATIDLIPKGATN